MTLRTAMARKVIVEFADDIDGSEAAQTVTFAVRGVGYEIDLSADNAAKFDEAIALYVANARRVGGRKRSPGRAGGTPEGIDPAAVRIWAAQQGIAVGPRGRIPIAIVEQYRSTL
jgi:hypothetical protein